MSDPPILIDVSRLIWRQWTRRLPTGIDRVCLAYLNHFHANARAVIQFRRYRRILDRSGSDRLFRLLLNGTDRFRSDLLKTLIATATQTEQSSAGQIYLNVGHTGLNSPQLGPWLSKRRLRPVFLIHDLIPITHPQYCRDGESDRHEIRMETALRSATGLIFNSTATQRDLAAFASDRDLAMPTSQVAWLGTDPAPVRASASSVSRGRPYFVMIGTIEARKNHLLMLQAWREIVGRLGDAAPDLIIIGQRGWEADQAISILEDPGQIRDHLLEITGCDDQRMISLLSGARAMLMPSFVEGFGLPVVEALRQGVPVIASDLAVFREIAGKIPTYLDPCDQSAWVRAVIDYCGGSAERQRQLNEATGFKAPDWDSHFALIEPFLERL